MPYDKCIQEPCAAHMSKIRYNHIMCHNSRQVNNIIYQSSRRRCPFQDFVAATLHVNIRNILSKAIIRYNSIDGDNNSLLLLAFCLVMRPYWTWIWVSNGEQVLHSDCLLGCIRRGSELVIATSLPIPVHMSLLDRWHSLSPSYDVCLVAWMARTHSPT